MAGKFELKSTASGKFMFNLKASNGQIIFTSQRYNAKPTAENGIESVKKNSQIDQRFDRRVAKDNSPYFVLKASNGQIIGKSEMYSRNASMENGIQSVKNNAPDAATKDLT